MKFPINKIISVALISLACVSLSFADKCYTCVITQINPILSVGLGPAWTSNVGMSQSFPIENPVTDLFYNYSTNNQWSRSTIYNLFVGAQFTSHNNTDYDPEIDLLPNREFQLGIDYTQSTAFNARGTLVQGADALSENTFTYHYGVVIRQLLAEVKGVFTVGQLYHPYLLGGIGVSFNKAFNYYTSAPSNVTFTRMYSNNSNASFSYALGAGIDMDVTPHLRFGIGYRFADAGKVVLNNATIDTTPVSGSLTQDHLYTQEVLMQFTFIV